MTQMQHICTSFRENKRLQSHHYRLLVCLFWNRMRIWGVSVNYYAPAGNMPHANGWGSAKGYFQSFILGTAASLKGVERFSFLEVKRQSLLYITWSLCCFQLKCLGAFWVSVQTTSIDIMSPTPKVLLIAERGLFHQ